MDNTKHTANYLASRFFGSKISLKKIYNLKNCHWSIVRYICDSIDKNHKKTKKFETKLYQSQIAKFTFLSRKTINIEIQFLIKKRILQLNDNGAITIGKTLYACNLRLQDKEVLPNVTHLRSVTTGYISNSSNFTKKSNGSSNHKTQESHVSSVEKQSTTFDQHRECRQEKGSDLLEAWIKQNERGQDAPKKK